MRALRTRVRSRTAASGRPPQADLEELRQGFRGEHYARFVEKDWFEPALAAAHPATRAAVLRTLRATPRELFMGTIYGWLGFDAVSAVTGFADPKLAVDAVVKDGPKRFHDLVPGIGAHLVPDVSHWLQLDAPEEPNRVLEGFLAGLA